MEETIDWKNSDKQFAFYWINDGELITCNKSENPAFKSNNSYLISIDKGMGIYNNREW